MIWVISLVCFVLACLLAHAYHTLAKMVTLLEVSDRMLVETAFELEIVRAENRDLETY